MTPDQAPPMNSVPQLLASDRSPLDIVEPIGHAIINKAEAEAFHLAQLTEPEAVVLVLWGFYGVAMNHPLEQALSDSSVSALYLAFHRIGVPHIAAALARADDPQFFTTHQHESLSRLLDYVRAHQDSILAHEQIPSNVSRAP